MEKYVRVKPLGKGSFGAAILIRRKADNQLLVVKEVNLTKMSSKEREEARNECKVLQQLNHPNIVRYIEHYELRGVLYIIMEYADGGDLAEKIRASPGRMREDTIMYYFSQLCLALEYLHSRHILHRDIKTMNIFLMKNGAVKLGDFGISTVLRNTMGMANTVCGTPYYFSPELCRNKPYNNRSDVWAMGVVLYELATGKHPFDGNSMTQLMQRIVRNTVPTVPSTYSREMRQLTDLCLQKDPNRRPNIKQLLAHPCVRTALEKLETDLMLATQCRVRLQDIIDFPVSKGNSDRTSSRSTSPEPQRPAGNQPAIAARPSPQQAAAAAPPQAGGGLQQAKNDLDRVDAFIHQLGKPVNDYAKDAIQAYMKRKQDELAARKAKEAEALKKQEERNAELRRVMEEHHKQMLEHAKLRQQRLQQQHNAPAHLAGAAVEAPPSARPPQPSQDRAVSPSKHLQQKRPSALGIYGSPTPRRNVRHVLAANSPRVASKQPASYDVKPKAPSQQQSASPSSIPLHLPSKSPAMVPLHEHALTPPARVLAQPLAPAKASNWVDRQQNQRRSDAEQKRRDDDKKAVRDLDAHLVVGKPVGKQGSGGPSGAYQAGPSKRVVDPELEAWVKKHSSDSNNNAPPRPSPRNPHSERDELPAGVEARRRQSGVSPDPLAPDLQRHISQADMVLRQQNNQPRGGPGMVRRSTGDLPLRDMHVDDASRPRTPTSDRSNGGRSGRSIPNAQLVTVQPTFSRSSSNSSAMDPKHITVDMDDEGVRDYGPQQQQLRVVPAPYNARNDAGMMRYANDNTEDVDFLEEHNLLVPEIIRVASTGVADFQMDNADLKNEDSNGDVPVDAYEAMLTHLQHVLEAKQPNSHAANRHKAAIDDADGITDVVDTEEYMLQNDDDDDEGDDSSDSADFADEVPLTPSHVRNNSHDDSGAESNGEQEDDEDGDDGLPDVASEFYLKDYCGIGFKGQYAVNPSNGTPLFPSKSVSRQTNDFQLRVILERAMGSQALNKVVQILQGGTEGVPQITTETLQSVREVITSGSTQRRKQAPTSAEVSDFFALCCQMIYFGSG